jgi:hypothetical protein
MTRKWFQLHLSTAIVLMFVAGVFIGANVLSKPLWAVNKNEGQRQHMRGWPCAVYSSISDNLHDNDNGNQGGGVSGYYESDPHWRISGIAFNGTILVAVVLSVATVCESLHRREINKP